MQESFPESDIIQTPTGITLKVPKQFFTREAVSLSMYKFTDEFNLSMSPIEEGYVGVSFKGKHGQSKVDTLKTIDAFRNELVDQQVRFDLEERYGSLRNTIVDFAFDPQKKNK